MKKLLSVLTIALISLTVAGCYNDYGSDDYNGATAGQAQTVRYGVIVQASPVTIEDEGNQGVGTLAGVAVGAVLGSTIGGGGTAHALGGIGGGLAGGAAGSAAGKAVGKQKGVRYIVKLRTGNALSIVQAPEPALAVGQHVMVLTGSDGRDVVVADDSSQADSNTQKSNN